MNELSGMDLNREDVEGNVVPGVWRQNQVLAEMARQGGNRLTRVAKQQRMYVKGYYVHQ